MVELEINVETPQPQRVREQELGVEIPPDRLEVERFRTLTALAELVAECRALDTSDAA